MITDPGGTQASAILAGSTPVVFRGECSSARVVTVGINPSIREFFTRGGAELDGDLRRFETTASLGVESGGDLSDDMRSRTHRRCLDYFRGNPYLDWFSPMEGLVQDITGASFFDGSAYHLDLVHWATDPLWGQLSRSVRRELLDNDRPAVIDQLARPSLQIIYLNGRTVCEEVAGFVTLSHRPAQFRGQGSTRRFFRGRHGDALVVGCSSNIQEERIKAVDRVGFLQWVVTECRRDLDTLRGAL